MTLILDGTRAGIHSIAHTEWWGSTQITSTGHNLRILEILKNKGAPILDVQGELTPDEENFQWFYETDLLYTHFGWTKKR